MNTNVCGCELACVRYAKRTTGCYITNEFLPQADILRHTNLFISHCGMGGLNEACIAGVPVLLFPNPQNPAAKRRAKKKNEECRVTRYG